MNKITKTLSYAAVCALGLTLMACESQPLATSSAGEDGRTVALVATAPDGTKLWRFKDGYGWTVYFASSGTQRQVSCGKGCTRPETVPTDNVVDDQDK